MIEISSGTMVTGASDDLIEISGELEEEFNCFDCSEGCMAFSDGTLLRVNYNDDGIWRFRPIVKGCLFEKIEVGLVEEDTNDEVYFASGLKWCVFSDEMQVEVNRVNKNNRHKPATINEDFEKAVKGMEESKVKKNGTLV